MPEETEDNELSYYPENAVELQKDVYTPDREYGRTKSKYHRTIFKELNLGNFNKADERVLMSLQSIEETLLSWGLYDTALYFNAEKQAYACITRGRGGEERKLLTTQRHEVVSTNRGNKFMEKIRPKASEENER